MSPFVAGALSWLLADVTISVQDCATGAGTGSVAGTVGFFVVLAVPPLGTAWHSRHARPFRDLVPAIVLSVVLAFPLVILGEQLWWVGHGCYT